MAHPSDSAPMLWLAPGSLSSRGRSFWILVFTCITCDTSSPCVTLVQLLGHIQLFVTPGLQHTRLPCPSPSPGVCSNSRLLSKWYNNHCIIILLNYNNFFFFASLSLPLHHKLLEGREFAFVFPWPKWMFCPSLAHKNIHCPWQQKRPGSS